MKTAIKVVAGQLIDIHNRNIYPAEITINNGIIEAVRRVSSAPEQFILPGLTDAHIHIESSMATPGAFASEAVKHGTVSVVSDPHEIANVLGVDGVRFMIEDSKKVPLKFYFGAPSCVPATTFETSGALIDSTAIKELLDGYELRYLSEMMNFPGVISGDPEVLKKIEIARSSGKPVDGHAPGLTGDMLKKYVSAGISTDHECSTYEEAREKIGLGMKILIREGSAAKNMAALRELIKTNPESVMLCSDDLHPEMLVTGHINKLVSALIKEGYDLFDVLAAATANPVFHYKLDSGLLRSGDSADFILVNSPEKMDVIETWINGEKVYDRGEVMFCYLPGNAVNRFRCSKISENDIRVKAETASVRVISAMDGELLTDEFIWEHKQHHEVNAIPETDILKLVVKDRYNDGPPSTGFIRGFGLKEGAFAGSVAHDSHNIICVGTNDADMVSAINEIVRVNGGLAFTSGNKVKSLQLDIAGIMSTRPVSEIAATYQELTELVRQSGCQMAAPFMTLSFMALLVIPDLKLSDKGLFDVRQFRLVSLFV